MLKGTISFINTSGVGGTIEQADGSMNGFESASPAGAVVGSRVSYDIDNSFSPAIAINLVLINTAFADLEIEDDDLIQSPYTYLQAVGSTGTAINSKTGLPGDGSTEGIHLRWEFYRSLDAHLPKGNLAAPGGTYYTSAGFNRENDFVKIYRAPYTIKYQAIVNLDTAPDVIDLSNEQRVWIYNVQVSSSSFPVMNTSVFLRFADVSIYDGISIDPATDTLEFIKAYTGVIEVGAIDKLSFAATLFMQLTNPGGGNPGITRAETISTPENDDGLPDAKGNPISEKLIISCRHKFMDNNAAAGDTIPIVENTAILQFEDTFEHILLAENIKYIRFDYQNNFPVEIRIETYADFITGANNHETEKWEQLGDFSLSDDDTVVFPRLDNDDIDVDGNWPRFYVNSNNPPNPDATQLKVRIDNYKDKWEKTNPSYVTPSPDGKRIKDGVIKYLQKSQFGNNPLAYDTLSVVADPDIYGTYNQYIPPDPPPNPIRTFKDNNANIQISYLNLLKIAAVDFHIARMLGLGHIDPETSSPVKFGNKKFIYLKFYKTTTALEDGAAADVSHFYMTMPTGKEDDRLPKAPDLQNPVYGLTAPSLPNPIQITDSNGYMPFDRIRYIRLFINEPDELEFPDPLTNPLPLFFSPNPENLFCLEEGTQPVFFGVEYKLQSETDFRSPELSNDENYKDANNVFEVMPLIADFQDPQKAIFIHDERQEGIHDYAMYSVNWFSRASSLSNIVITDETNFPHICTLLPPANFAVQLIQKESPLLFTSQTEQQRLADINTGTTSDDEILVRATFEWNESHHIAYTKTDNLGNISQAADEIELFFRSDLPVTIKGIITAIDPAAPSLNDNDTVDVTVGSYSYTYNNTTVTVTPVIPAGMEDKYIGSFLNVDGTKYKIVNISNSGTLFTLKKNAIATLTAVPAGSSTFVSVQTFHSPSVGNKFSVSENDTDASNWATGKLTRTVPIENFLTETDNDGNTLDSPVLHAEIRINPDSSKTTLNIGGIFEKAQIIELPGKYSKDHPDVPDDDDPGTTPNPGDPTPNSGIFEITFNTFQLTNHPDFPDVEWYKGTIRVPIAGSISGEKKILTVFSIDQTQTTLVIKAFDPTYSVDNDFNPLPGYSPIQTGANVLVNFHPGYRVYLLEETGIFDQPSILPSQGQGTKQSLMSARSSDVDISEGCFSPLAPPALLLALEIVSPEQPGMPLGPLFATRPDFNGKSTYTFDVEVETKLGTRKPHALIFYRASEQMIFSTLYKKATIDAINTALTQLTISERQSALMDFVTFNLDGVDYITYTISAGGTFKFPNPDNSDFEIPITLVHPFPADGSIPPGNMLSSVKLAVHTSFLPLTEQPVIYQFIDYGFQPSNRKPKIKNSETGRFLTLGDSGFDPFPMCVRYEKDSSGSTLPSGSGTIGAANNSYFVRFTDFTLDGTSINVYFFYAQELMQNFTTGTPGTIAGPISLVNSYPAKPVEIKKVVTQLANPIDEIPTAVKFEINPYVENERIKRFQIYRATKPEDMRSIRTMKLAKMVEAADVVTDLLDDFSDVDFPLYGDPLFYRIVALREIINEQNLSEDIPSFPSDAVLASVVDVFNPAAPDLDYASDELTTVSPVQLPNVILKWNKTAHNSTYFLYKMNNSGNWVLQTQIKSNDSKIFYPVGNLLKEDDDGNEIFHRYKVDVENSSGLLNLEEKALVI